MEIIHGFVIITHNKQIRHFASFFWYTSKNVTLRLGELAPAV